MLLVLLLVLVLLLLVLLFSVLVLLLVLHLVLLLPPAPAGSAVGQRPSWPEGCQLDTYETVAKPQKDPKKSNELLVRQMSDF